MFAQVSPRVEERLTPLGHTLYQPLDALRDWAAHHPPDIDGALQAAAPASPPSSS